MACCVFRRLTLASCLSLLPFAIGATEHEIIIESGDSVSDAPDEILIESDDTSMDSADEILIESDDTSMDSTDENLIESDGTSTDSTDEILLEPADDEPYISIDTDEEHPVPDVVGDDTADMPGRARFRIEDAWLEGGYVTQSDSSADRLGYGKLAASWNWQPTYQWEFQLSGRADLYNQHGSDSDTDVDVDYGDSFMRYRGDDIRLTLGSQTVIWGRIDELPPSDRVSTIDARRAILDDLPDRRLSTPMIRAEAFFESAKLDLIWLPVFRGAELPSQDSIWYPVNKHTGRILGVDPDDVPPAVVKASKFVDDTPNGDGGFGARYTRTQSNIDFGLTLARTRQSTPYFRSAGVGRFEAEYPRSWAYGVDAAVEAAGATWRAEVVYTSDNPVTRENFDYTTVNGVSWGAAVEFHPGDGDTRVNLQLVGMNLIDTPDVIDRTDIYNFNGSVEIPFAQNRWQADVRFFAGLDEKDLYINPKISFLGWEPHEVYMAFHYFNGADETYGGFYEDQSNITLGWRSEF